MDESLKDILGWGSPIGLGYFLIAVGILARLAVETPRKGKHKQTEPE